MARPSKQTPETVRALEEALGLGCNVVDACLQAGISESTFYDWCKADKKLSDRLSKLKKKQVLKARNVVDKALDDGDVNTAKWLLERKEKEEFSTQINQVVDATVSKKTAQEMTDDELLRIATDSSS